MRRISHGFVLLALACSAATATGCYSRLEIATEAPPAPRAEFVVTQPGYLWIRGHHVYTDGRWAWRGGYYERVRPGYVYTDGYWQRRGTRQVWVNGAWRRRTS